MKKMIFTVFAITLGTSLALDAAIVPVSTVADLVEALRTNKTTSTTIEIAPGDYDLTGVKMDDDKGGSHLLANYVKLRGTGDGPDKVRLIGDGTLRVLRSAGGDSQASSIANLTITNGYAKTVSGVSGSGCGGGQYGYVHVVTNCIIADCKADSLGGGVYNYTYVYDSQLLNNSATTGGGAYHPGRIWYGSLVAGNTATDNGGGIYGISDGYGSVRDSRIIGNSAGGYGGGIARVQTVSNCFVSLNTAVTAGGGIACHSQFSRTSKYVVFDSIVCSNLTSSTSGDGAFAGGVDAARVYGGEIFGNSGRHGGGASRSVLVGVDIHDNYANGYGGGSYNSELTNCVVSCNFAQGSGKNGYGNTYFGCDISYTTDTSGKYTDCVVHHMGVTVQSEGNPYTDISYTASHALEDIPVCTNCLFRDNSLKGYGNSLIVGRQNATRPAYFVNCTVVSNIYGKTFSYFQKADYPIYVQNCVFYGNRYYDGNQSDLCGWSDEGTLLTSCIRMSNTAYGKSNGVFAGNTDWMVDPETVWKFGTDGFKSNPRFVGDDDPDHPYALKHTSPLLGLGAVAGWMTGRGDIRGPEFPRLRDGKVDLGCYQCWITPPGTRILIR